MAEHGSTTGEKTALVKKPVMASEESAMAEKPEEGGSVPSTLAQKRQERKEAGTAVIFSSVPTLSLMESYQ